MKTLDDIGFVKEDYALFANRDLDIAVSYDTGRNVWRVFENYSKGPDFWSEISEYGKESDIVDNWRCISCRDFSSNSPECVRRCSECRMFDSANGKCLEDGAILIDNYRLVLLDVGAMAGEHRFEQFSGTIRFRGKECVAEHASFSVLIDNPAFLDEGAIASPSERSLNRIAFYGGRICSGDIVCGDWNDGTFAGGELVANAIRGGTFCGTEAHSVLVDGGVFSSGRVCCFEWRFGTFLGGTLSCTVWNGGVFKGGTFLCGTWNSGRFEGGTFRGTWKGGEWAGGNWEGCNMTVPS